LAGSRRQIATKPCLSGNTRRKSSAQIVLAARSLRCIFWISTKYILLQIPSSRARSWFLQRSPHPPIRSHKSAVIRALLCDQHQPRFVARSPDQIRQQIDTGRRAQSAQLRTGDNVARAMECYQAALRVCTERDFPLEWAAAVNGLGIAGELAVQVAQHPV
jgi:hypothetical protein